MASELHILMDTSALGLPPAKSLKARAHKSMRAQVADSMVAQYLQNAGHEYSLSTFLPEAGICLDEVQNAFSIQLIQYKFVMW